jgi:hypothetical protein
MTELLGAYGFKLGDIVLNKVELIDEHGNVIVPGTKLRIVAFTPKVQITKGNPKYYDNKVYFFNAVRNEQTENYSHRIRANFCTIKKFQENKMPKIPPLFVFGKINKKELTDRIYDTLLQNTHWPQFPIEKLTWQWVNHEEKTIYLEFNNEAFLLTLTKTKVLK